MQYDHPTLKVSSPAPGHYVIEGLPSASTSTEEGRLVHPLTVHIPPALPSDLLLAIVEDRGDKAGARLVELEDEAGGDKGSEEVEPGEGADYMRICRVLGEQGGTMRIRDLATAAGVEVDFIKANAGKHFELGSAGWVKLKQEGGEA